MAGVLMGFFIGMAEGNAKPGNNIAELNRLEKELSERKDRVKALDEPDENLSVLVGQLDAELGKLKKGKADEGAIERAKELMSMVDKRLEGKDSPIKELQRRVNKIESDEKSKEPEKPVAKEAPAPPKPAEPEKKPGPKPEPAKEEPVVVEKAPEPAGEKGVEALDIVEDIDIDGEGDKMVEENILKKQEDKIKEEMKSKLVEEDKKKEQKKREEEAFEEVEEGLFNEEKSEKVEEGYIAPEEPKKPAEKPAPKQSQEKAAPKPAPTPAAKGNLDAEKAEALYKASVEQLLKAQLENGAIIPCSAEKSYMHIYPRDHGFCTLALLRAGKFDEAKKALEFALSHQNKKDGNFPQRWDEAGGDAGAKEPQPDATAMVLYALAEYVLEKNNIDFAEKNWDKVEKGVDFIVDKLRSDKNLVFSPSSIHEYPPIEEGYEIWTNAVCCAAFRELCKVSDKIKIEYEPLGKENVLKDSLMEYMWNSRTKTFVKAIKIKGSSSVLAGPDASVLALPFFGVFKPKDKRVALTVKLVDEKLWDKSYGGISKYIRAEGRDRGGFGTSPFFTLLLADYYIKAGEREKAEKYLNRATSMSFNGLLPEHFATKEDFEGYVSDFSDAGLLSRDLMKMINRVRKHEDFKNGVAHISEPFSMAHAAFIIVWLNYKEKFQK